MHRTDAELRRLRVCAGSARLNARFELANKGLCLKASRNSRRPMTPKPSTLEGVLIMELTLLA